MRQNIKPKALNQLLTDDSTLNIYTKSQTLADINKLVQQYLPAFLKPHCKVANFRQGVLVIATSNASWQTRLRYEHENLLHNLRQAKLSSLSPIQYKIDPTLSKATFKVGEPEQVRPQRKLTNESAALLLHLAENSSPGLKMQLIKLAKHAKNLD